jgi:ubiquitin-protein ligase
MAAYESPRIRRLKSDLAALEALRAESSVFQFRSAGNPPQQYLLGFRGKSLSRDRGKVVVRDFHEVEIKLGASYPRTMPELRWLTPIYHPNISEIGMVCLGAYGTHWVPSLALDELCVMLWDMARYQNYDIRSPYNREAALWAANQTAFRFPIDARALRDKRAALGRTEAEVFPLYRTDTGAIPLGDGAAPRPKIEGDSMVILDMEIDLRPRPRDMADRPIPPPTPVPPPPAVDVIFID